MIMKKKRIIIFLIGILIFSFFLLFSDVFWDKKENEIYDISIIINSETSESWKIVKQGIDQATIEMNINTSFITLSEERSVEEQIALIEREINSGADAILIAPVDYEKMTKSIEDAINKVPIVLIESNINSNKGLNYISCENYELGIKLAEEVTKNKNERSEIVIIKNGLEVSSIRERYEGFTDTIKISGSNYTFIEFSNDDNLEYNKVKKILEEKKVDVVVSFDASTLELVGEAKKDLNKSKDKNIDVEIYGVGSTRTILPLLEDGTINSIGVQNEFNIGYLGIEKALDILNGEKIKKSTIESTIVTSTNMYSKENQRLLFPFIR